MENEKKNKEQLHCQKCNPQDAPSSSSSSGANAISSCDQESVVCQHDKEHSDDQSDGKSSTGSGETTCASWRTRSENWSKKRRTFKGTTSSKKDFFGKRNKKWPMRKVKGDATEVESPPTGSLSCVCTMYRRTNSESEATAGPSGVGSEESLQGILSNGKYITYTWNSN